MNPNYETNKKVDERRKQDKKKQKEKKVNANHSDEMEMDLIKESTVRKYMQDRKMTNSVLKPKKW